MTQARTKFVVLPILILGSWTILAAQTRTAEPRTIHFAPKVTAPNETLREALANTMLWFRNGLVQAKFVDSEEKADYAFTGWSVSTTPSMISISMTYRGPGVPSQPLTKSCRTCDVIGLEALVYELLDETLLNPSDGLYRPMRIRQCQETDQLSLIRATVEPANGMALENSLPYVIAEPADPTASRWRTRRITPRFNIEALDEGNASATFRLLGNAKTISAFRTQDCSSRMRPLAMQPRVALLTAGERNRNAFRGD
jgi:hypothetical protein